MKDRQHIIDKKHGIIDIIIIIKGDISINEFSSVQLLDNILSSVIFIIFIYILLNGICGYFLIKRLSIFLSIVLIKRGFLAII